MSNVSLHFSCTMELNIGLDREYSSGPRHYSNHISNVVGVDVFTLLPINAACRLNEKNIFQMRRRYGGIADFPDGHA